MCVHQMAEVFHGLAAKVAVACGNFVVVRDSAWSVEPARKCFGVHQGRAGLVAVAWGNSNYFHFGWTCLVGTTEQSSRCFFGNEATCPVMVCAMVWVVEVVRGEGKGSQDDPASSSRWNTENMHLQSRCVGDIAYAVAVCRVGVYADFSLMRLAKHVLTMVV